MSKSSKTTILSVIVGILCLAGALPFFLDFPQIKSRFLSKLIEAKQSTHSSQITKLILKQQGEYSLPSSLFAELLSLSCDQPSFYEEFATDQAEKHLSLIGIFKKIKLKKCRSEALLIEYELYQPAYIWGEYTNTLINDQGLPMPYAPYFSPKQLPTIYLGKEQIKTNFMQYLEDLVHLLDKGKVEMVDLQGRQAVSKSHREIIVRMNQQGNTHLLRLDPAALEKQLFNYCTLLTYFKDVERSLLIDLRFPESAYITSLLR